MSVSISLSLVRGPRVRSLRRVSVRFHGTVLVFGDSNTWGYDPNCEVSGSSGPRRIPHHRRWPTLLQTRLGEGLRVVDEGLNGRTTLLRDPSSPADGAYSCDGRRDLVQALHSHKPLSAVVLALGTNDLKARFNLSPADVAYNLRILVQEVRRGPEVALGFRRPPPVLLVGLPALRTTPLSSKWGFVEGSAERAARANALIRAMADECEAGFADVSKEVSPSPADGVHYAEDAQPSIAAAVHGALVTLLARPPESQ